MTEHLSTPHRPSLTHRHHSLVTAFIHSFPTKKRSKGQMTKEAMSQRLGPRCGQPLTDNGLSHGHPCLPFVLSPHPGLSEAGSWFPRGPWYSLFPGESGPPAISFPGTVCQLQSLVYRSRLAVHHFYHRQRSPPTHTQVKRLVVATLPLDDARRWFISCLSPPPSPTGLSSRQFTVQGEGPFPPACVPPACVHMYTHRHRHTHTDTHTLSPPAWGARRSRPGTDRHKHTHTFPTSPGSLGQTGSIRWDRWVVLGGFPAFISPGSRGTFSLMFISSWLVPLGLWSETFSRCIFSSWAQDNKLVLWLVYPKGKSNWDPSWVHWLSEKRKHTWEMWTMGYDELKLWFPSN